MSKIYEALLRAEKERTAASDSASPNGATVDSYEHGIGDAPERPAPVAAAIATITAEPETAPSSGPAYAASSAAHSASVVTQEPAAFPPEPEGDSDDASSSPLLPGEFSASVPGLDLTGIRVMPWKPMLDKLPSLEERGSSVEQFRSLRTRLFGFRDLNKIKSVMVSSGLPREGKSFVAANLAISLARHKASRVLLIDGDMRRSSQHHIFGTTHAPGLTTYLSGQASIVDVMQRAQLNENGIPLLTGLGSLTFIPGGEEGDKAADLAGSARFRQLIAATSPFFDWIIVDSSPVNLVTDGVNLAAACDGVLLVARGGITKFQSAQRALAELKAARVLGVVLNAVEKNPQTEGYYGYSSYDSVGQTAGAANP